MRTGRRAYRPYLAGTGRMTGTPDGFHTVGDTGRLDADGYLFLEPRQIASISVAGVTVLPDEVESVLLEHPSVLDAAVCAVPDEIFGERPVAMVVPGAGAPDGRALRAWAGAHLSPAQLPVRVELVAGLPRDDAGKLRRHELPALARGDRDDG
jgi:acyl-coenzyme A synthetase/AMP-(fatty) acid ligase